MIRDFKLGISVSGGGALGIGPAYFLKLLEEDLAKDPILNAQTAGPALQQSFDAFSGTSVGSIIAALMLDGYSSKDIYNLFSDKLKTIFTKNNFFYRLLPKVPTYNNKYLTEILNNYLIGKIGEWDRPIYIPVTIMNRSVNEKVWDLRDKDVNKSFAVLSSSSAPTYFSTVTDGELVYCDGGLWANDPIMTLLSGLMSLKEDLKVWKVLSFKTTMTNVEDSSKHNGNKTLAGWAKYLVSDWVARSGEANFFEAQTVLGNDQIFRISIDSDLDLKLDSTDDESVEDILKLWEEKYNSVKSDLIAFMFGYKNRDHSPRSINN